jgi:hypothetical protein
MDFNPNDYNLLTYTHVDCDYYCASKIFTEEAAQFLQRCKDRFPTEMLAMIFFLSCCDVASKLEITLRKERLFENRQGEWAKILIQASKGISIRELFRHYYYYAIPGEADRSTVNLVVIGFDDIIDLNMKLAMEAETTTWFLNRLGLSGGIDFDERWTSEGTTDIVSRFITLHTQLKSQFPADSYLTLRNLHDWCVAEVGVRILPNRREYFWKYYLGLASSSVVNLQDDAVITETTAAVLAAAHTANMLFNNNAEKDDPGVYRDDGYHEYEELIDHQYELRNEALVGLNDLPLRDPPQAANDNGEELVSIGDDGSEESVSEHSDIEP